MSIFGPVDFDVRWEEMIHKADETVFNTELNVLRGVEDTLRWVFGGSKDK